MDDRDALVALGRASFDAAFGHLYSAKNLASFLHSAHSPEKIAQQIADRNVVYRLAFRGERLVGYCKLVEGAQFGGHSDAARPIALSQLYTDAGSTGNGIGSGLMEWVLAEAKTRRADAIQLSVWAENLGAQRFYQRHGFAKIADIDFWVGDHRDDEFLYERKL
ncbi:GNAT family N-acetyltransferase [Croceicoccus ponticola]|uniref:GNAT family N-acetyltransferase n=1 Tax=Croceicoccus ponticola TaxID=2217664 RepID=A0A437GYK9_9SPHN|nr:GNAT family N-acetyltransferase [Croceicoccus ponticola]RVQ67753.1 GNAT family N-acetyltransferase [Croceicoccus ponticola]